MSDDDKFTPEEEENFNSLTAEEKAKLARYLKWAGQKEKSGAVPSEKSEPKQSGTSPANSLELTLNQLKALIADEGTSSILRHLLEAANVSSKKVPAKPAEPVKSGIRALRLL
jgi:hypothetical protein